MRKLFFATLPALHLLACGGSGPGPTPVPQATVYQAGFSYDPAVTSDSPVPVVWAGTDSPVKLPTLSYGNCPGTGHVDAMTLVDGEPVMVGTAYLCIDDDQFQKPALWAGGVVTQLGYWDHTHIYGRATGIAVHGGSVLVVGAEGTNDPLPTLWWDGAPQPIPLPADLDWEYGEAESILVVGDTVYIGALVTRGTPPDMEWGAGYWTWEMNQTEANLTWTPLPFPDGANRLALRVPVAAANGDVWAGYSPYQDGPTSVKPAISYGGADPAPLIDFDFGASPFGQVDALAATATSTIAVGYETLDEQYGMPGPVYWVNGVDTKLSTVDSTLGIGMATTISLVGSQLYVGGQTYQPETPGSEVLVAVPAYWVDGVRHDRQGLSSSGSVVGGATPLPTWRGWPAPATASLGGGFQQNVSRSAVVTTTVVVTK